VDRRISFNEHEHDHACLAKLLPFGGTYDKAHKAVKDQSFFKPRPHSDIKYFPFHQFNIDDFRRLGAGSSACAIFVSELVIVLISARTATLSTMIRDDRNRLSRISCQLDHASP